jgi:stage III sporulation protein AE
MPESTDSFIDGLLELLQKSIRLMLPDIQEASDVCTVIVAVSVLCAMIPIVSERTKNVSEVVGVAVILNAVFRHTNSLILLASDTVQEIFEYGKLLCQVMTAALSAQGGAALSTGLYVGTVLFIALLGWLVSIILVPLTGFYLLFAVGNCAFEDEFLNKAAISIKGFLLWSLKTLMVVFTTYMSITSVVTGSADLAVMKSVKTVFSAVVPIVGGILSDSSEAVLAGMAMVKNAAGIYGLLAVLSIFTGPFLRIGIHYLMIKMTAILCCVFGSKRISALADCLSGTMSILLAMVASGCMLVTVSMICFLKGTGG